MHIIAEASDRSIEDPVVMPTALAALAGQALKQILAHLQRKAEAKEFNPLLRIPVKSATHST